jgi:ABC-type uncharacterized transport system substrate-binding protein
MQVNNKTVVSYEIEVESFRGEDDFDAYFSEAVFADGTKATDEELAQLGERYSEKLAERAYDSAVIASDFLF